MGAHSLKYFRKLDVKLSIRRLLRIGIFFDIFNARIIPPQEEGEYILIIGSFISIS